MSLRSNLILIIILSFSTMANAYLNHAEIIELFDETADVDENQIYNVVDLRSRDTPIKRQFGNASTAFALIAAMENLLGNPDIAHLSERHLWSQYRDSNPQNALAAANSFRITEEHMWAQDSQRPSPGYLDLAHTRLTEFTEHDENLDGVVESLDRGSSVFSDLNITSRLGSCAADVDDSGEVSENTHSVAIVGYGLDERIPGGGYLIAKNSWGVDCGDEGYQYIAFSYCLDSDITCNFWEVVSVESDFSGPE